MPNRDNILWIKIVTIKGTWVIGAAYSRPGFLKEHAQMMMDITEDISTLRQDKDVVGIILGGDLNTRLGTITGDHDSSEKERVRATCNMINTSGLAICTNCIMKGKQYTCIKSSGKSVNDLILVSTDLKGDNNRKTKRFKHPMSEHTIEVILKGITVQKNGHCGSDHRLITYNWTNQIKLSPPIWGKESKTKYLFDPNNIKEYDKKINSSRELSGLIDNCKILLNKIKKTQKLIDPKKVNKKNQKPAPTKEICEIVAKSLVLITDLAKITTQVKPTSNNMPNQKFKRPISKIR